MTMKKIFSILSLVLMFACCNFALTSCSDDDDDDTNDDKSLVGTWKDTTYMEGFEYGLTFNTDGTYSYYWKYTGTTDPNNIIVKDKEGYLTKHKGTYTVSEDELILKQEYGYYPAMNKTPNAEWEKDVRIGKIDIEWLENNQFLQLNPHDDMPPLKLRKTK